MERSFRCSPNSQSPQQRYNIVLRREQGAIERCLSVGVPRIEVNFFRQNCTDICMAFCGCQVQWIIPVIVNSAWICPFLQQSADDVFASLPCIDVQRGQPKGPNAVLWRSANVDCSGDSVWLTAPGGQLQLDRRTPLGELKRIIEHFKQ